MTPEETEILRLSKRSGQAKVLCPYCSHTRRQSRLPCMSLKRESDRILYQCWHCNVSGVIFTETPYVRKKQVSNVVKIIKEQHGLSDDHRRWLEIDRGINPEVIERFGLYSEHKYFHALGGTHNAITFPYYREGIIYAAKHRGPSKSFSTTNALTTFYGAWIIDGKDVDTSAGGLVNDAVLVIAEGEMDTLAIASAITISETNTGTDGPAKNCYAVVGIPNGAVSHPTNSNPVDGEDRKFSYIWESRVLLERYNKIILALDSDKPGAITSDEIARRIGKERCWKVEWPDGIKDANEALINIGHEALLKLFDDAEPYPVSGLFEVEAFRDKVNAVLENGVDKGLSTGYDEVDDIYTIVPGQMTIVTGVPGHGKSEFVDQIMVNMAEQYDWGFAVCSFENDPPIHIAKLIAKRERKCIFGGPEMRPHKLTNGDRDRTLDWIDDHFVFLQEQHGELSTIESILERLRTAVMRYGIRGAVIDPYNYIARGSEKSETDWVSDMLSRVKAFCMAYDVHVWFIAHPRKMEQLTDGTIRPPQGYDISGSAAWYAKADMGITIHRPSPEFTQARILCWKSRFSWVGKVGSAYLNYDPRTFRYLGNSEIDFMDDV